MKARRLGDPERPDEDEEDLFFRRGRALGAAFARSQERRGVAPRLSRAARFPGVIVGDETRPWYQDPVKMTER